MNDKTGKKDKIWVYDKETKRDIYIDKSEYDANKHAKGKKEKAPEKAPGDPGKGMEWYYNEKTGRFSRQKKKIPSGSVISSSGKVTEGMEVAKGGIVKRYKGGLMVKPKAAKRGY